MAEKKDYSNVYTPLLLVIIVFLLGFMGWVGREQLISIKQNAVNFKKFQIETIVGRMKLDKTFELNRLWMQDVYTKEIQPNTLRSKKNEKDITKVKSDVSTLKSLIK